MIIISDVLHEQELLITSSPNKSKCKKNEKNLGKNTGPKMELTVYISLNPGQLVSHLYPGGMEGGTALLSVFLRRKTPDLV